MAKTMVKTIPWNLYDVYTMLTILQGITISPTQDNFISAERVVKKFQTELNKLYRAMMNGGGD